SKKVTFQILKAFCSLPPNLVLIFFKINAKTNLVCSFFVQKLQIIAPRDHLICIRAVTFV
uniref:Uncharacterized protein n=1 Tax=Ciona savignyi TaxID=51511 RepID=H2ZCV0_CIOSA